jgi:hypothetical protein
MIQRVPPEVIWERHREWEERQRERNGGQPRVRNVQPVLYLTDPFRVPYRGRMWLIPPVPMEDGARVLDLVDKLEKMQSGPDLARRYREFNRAILKLIRRLVLPERGWLRRVLWKLRIARNPWRTATHEEVGEMLGFFWMRRTKSPDRRPIIPDLDAARTC